MKPIVEQESPLEFISWLWNGFLGLMTLAWFALFAYITIKLAAQNAWGMATIAAVMTVVFGSIIRKRVSAIRGRQDRTTTLEVLSVLLSLLGIDGKE